MNRSSRERDRARRLSEYVDSLLLDRRAGAGPVEEFLAADREEVEVREIAELLSTMEIPAPTTYRDELARRLSAEAATATEATLQAHLTAGWRRFWAETWAAIRAVAVRVPGAPKAASAAAVVALAAFLVLSLVPNLTEVRLASAAEILNRSDLALNRLVRPGEILYRQWRTVSTAWPGPGDVGRSERVRVEHEWMDGANFKRVAGRTYDPDERLWVAYATGYDEGELRPRVYLAAGAYGEPRGALHLEPTRTEFERALRNFSGAERAALRLVLNRQYIYMPIAGERRFNQLLIEERNAAPPALPRIMLSFDEPVVNNQAVYRVRIVDPLRIRFNWRAEGPPIVRRSRAEIVRFIAQDSFLSLRSEETYQFEDGRRTFRVRELVEMRAISASDLPMDPFRLDDIPEETTTRRQQAVEWLTEVADALKRPALPSSP